jgi:hypothetical protein
MNNFGVNGSTPLTHVPMLMAHDAGSGYLGAGLVNRWTKTQPGGLAKQLDCGARAFDARPLFKDGQVVWHHGSIVIDHPFEQSVADILAWLSKHPTELVLLPISDCKGGDDCMAGVRAALSKLLVTEISGKQSSSPRLFAALRHPAALQRLPPCNILPPRALLWRMLGPPSLPRLSAEHRLPVTLPLRRLRAARGAHPERRKESWHVSQRRGDACCDRRSSV